MRTGVTRATNHQNAVFNLSRLITSETAHKKRLVRLHSLRILADKRKTENITLRFVPTFRPDSLRVNATLTTPFESSDRRISTPRLNTLRCFHLAPINVVISHESITIPHLGAGFPLRCFQWLSNPDIATGRCTWRYSPQTRGQFISVLSY